MTNALQQRLFKERESNEALDLATRLAKTYLSGAATGRPFPTDADIAKSQNAVRSPMPEDGADAKDVLAAMQETFENACVNTVGGRYFGFVTGGSLPASLAARLLSDVWDQNAPLFRTSPAAAIAEEVCENWLRDLLGLPEETVAGFVSGSSLAIYCGIAAARWRLLQRQGWDVNAKGIFGAPPLRVVAGRDAHGTVAKAISLLGFGTDNVEWVDVDKDGRVIAASLPTLDERTILLLQAGNVNGGGFDDFKSICAKAKAAGAWTHVDGAFGLWAAAARDYRHLTEGMSDASSWSCDAHKTLNTPYDCGIVFCRDADAIRSALHQQGSYLETGMGRDGMYMTPELSRRARAFDVWAALVSLGRQGVDDLVSLLCARATQFAEEIEAAGFTLAAKPSFNQLLFYGENDEETVRTLRAVQAGDTCWAAGADWFGRRVIRISVCSWATTEEDVTRSVNAFAEARNG